ncbi:MAG: hypothetical protein J6O04_00720 [Selenomonadaceae bacterium]|nr:hypothetical protein [Selenomonadaceae bacterium]
MVTDGAYLNLDEYEKIRELLLRVFSENYIRNVGIFLHEQAEKFLAKRRLKGVLSVNTNMSFCCVLDMLADLAHLRLYCDGDDINEMKIRAYAASWWIKRKPFQWNDKCLDLWINEKFALSLLLNAVDSSITNAVVYDENKAKQAVGELFYHLKHQNSNPQTLELFLLGLNAVRSA